ncbi:MAG: 1-deoxy-D-xylulose-5-phosphate synthase, partial [Clostridia bacterium]|nr:1-deoxy-D-xylulose-5-phosphate synthase [Clostridia bacterium]
GAEVLVISYGRLFSLAAEAAQAYPAARLKLNTIHPLDEALPELVARYPRIVFAEEGSEAGGIAEALAARLLKAGYRGIYRWRGFNAVPTTSKVMPALTHAGLDAASLSAWIGEVLHE